MPNRSLSRADLAFDGANRRADGTMDAIGVNRQKFLTVCELLCFLGAWAVGIAMALSEARRDSESQGLAVTTFENTESVADRPEATDPWPLILGH